MGDTGKFMHYPGDLFDKLSVIDYALGSESLLEEMVYFTVLPYNVMSDHAAFPSKLKPMV